MTYKRSEIKIKLNLFHESCSYTSIRLPPEITRSLLWTLHPGLQFPSSIALITHTQLNALSTHTQLNSIRHATQAMDFLFLTAEYCLAIAILRGQFYYHSLVIVLPCLFSHVLILARVSWITCVPGPVLDTVCPSPDYCSFVFTDYPFCQAHWILLAIDRPRPFWIILLSCPQYTSLPLFEPCLLWPRLCLIKACRWIRTSHALIIP